MSWESSFYFSVDCGTNEQAHKLLDALREKPFCLGFVDVYVHNTYAGGTWAGQNQGEEEITAYFNSFADQFDVTFYIDYKDDFDGYVFYVGKSAEQRRVKDDLDHLDRLVHAIAINPDVLAQVTQKSPEILSLCQQLRAVLEGGIG